jgi:hypothetical protein
VRGMAKEMEAEMLEMPEMEMPVVGRRQRSMTLQEMCGTMRTWEAETIAEASGGGGGGAARRFVETRQRCEWIHVVWSVRVGVEVGVRDL